MVNLTTKNLNKDLFTKALNFKIKTYNVCIDNIVYEACSALPEEISEKDYEIILRTYRKLMISPSTNISDLYTKKNLSYFFKRKQK